MQKPLITLLKNAQEINNCLFRGVMNGRGLSLQGGGDCVVQHIFKMNADGTTGTEIEQIRVEITPNEGSRIVKMSTEDCQ